MTALAVGKNGFLRFTSILVFTMVGIIFVQVAIFFIEPMPETAQGWLTLLHERPFLGLLHQDLLYLVNNTILIFMYFALYFTLGKKRESLLLIALIVGLAGALLYYTSNRAIEMYYLSQRYFSTSDPFVRSTYLALAESYLDIWTGTAFTVYYFLSGISLLIFSFVMLRSDVYSRTTAISGLVSGILMSVPSSFGMVGMIMALLSLVPWIVFSIMVAIRLHEAGRQEEDKKTNKSVASDVSYV
ncbi:MAG: hypothetical protein JXR38_06270 [Bacilli bacterium]|nr:hypothetical protein [Bacilli bacterium]